MTPLIDRTVLLLTRHQRSPREDRWLRAAVPRITDSEALFALAHDNLVAPRVWWELDRLGLAEGLPEPGRSQLREEAERVRRVNADRQAAGLVVLKALVERGVEVILLKGFALANTLYKDPGYKRMNDIDLLVRPRDVGAVMEVYAAHGFVPVGDRVKGTVEERTQRTNHLAAYVDREVSCIFGTQWDFRSPVLGFDFRMEDVWARSLPVVVDGVPLRVLSPEDNLHHISLHLERYKTGARDIMDLHNLIAVHADTLDWERLRSEVERAGTWDDVFYALSFAQAYRPCFELQDLLEALAPRVRPSIRHLAAHRTRSARVLLRISSRQFSTIEKELTKLNATGVFREKLPQFVRAWGTLLTPPLADALKISGFVEGTLYERLRARVVAPARLVAAIAEEIGWGLLLGLVLKTFVDLGIALVPRPNKPTLDTYAAKLGLGTEQLRAIQQAIQ